MTHSHLQHWTICDEFTIEEVIHLYMGIAPSDYHGESDFNGDAHEKYLAIKKALIAAIRTGTLPAEVFYEQPSLFNGDTVFDPEGNEVPPKAVADYLKSKVKTPDVVSWMKEKGIRGNFFTEEKAAPSIEQPLYKQQSHPNFAYKLAAAIEVWEALTTTPSLLRTETPKNAAEKWLRNNAERLGLIYEGKPNNSAILEIAKIVNWKRGGSITTPGSEN